MANLSDYIASQFGGTSSSMINDVKIYGGVASKVNGGTIAHGVGAAPTRYGATATVAQHIVAVTAVDATNLTIALHTDAGVAVAVAENVAWWAAR